MSNHEVEKLLSESGEPCVSIIVPTHRLSNDRIKDSDVVKKAVEYAKKLLRQNYMNPEYNTDILLNTLDEMVAGIDYTHSKNGIGIYISPRVQKIVKFPFPVIEKVKVGNSFESRDLLYHLNNIIDYYILSISKKHIHLFSGKGEEFQEIRNEEFPVNYEETYEYAKPSRGNSFGSNQLKEFEKDKSILQEIRLVDFLRIIDTSIGKYVNEHTPLVVSGGKKEIEDYLQVTHHKKRIIGKVSGIFNFNGNVQLASHAWLQVQNYLKEQNKLQLSNLREYVGKEMVATGIEDVWKAAYEGKGLQLFVEKDMEHHAFISSDGSVLKLRKPFRKNNYVYVNNAVERTIKLVREKKGKIIFVDNGDLSDFDEIALQLRYNNLP